VRELSRVANAMVLYGMVQPLPQMTRNHSILGRRLDSGKLSPKKLKNGNHVPMLTLVEIHGQSRKSNAGARISQHIHHGNVLRMEMNVNVTAVGSSMVPKQVLIKKNLISSEPSNFH